MSGIKINSSVQNGGRLPVANIGTLAQRPPFGIPQQIYIATDTSILYYDTGTAWVALLTGGGGTLTGADNGLSVAGTLVELGGSALTKTTAIDTGGQILAILPTNPQAGGTFSLQPTVSFIGFSNGAGGLYSISVGNNLVAIVAAAFSVSGLANVTADFFLQADAAGNITNVQLPISKADNGISIGTGGDANKIQLGGTLTKGTVIRNNTATGGPFRFAFIPAVGQSAAYFDFDTSGAGASFVGWLTSGSVFTGIKVVSTTNVQAIIGGIVVLNISATQFISSLLANADATKFLQADASGLVTSVAALINANNGLNVVTGVVKLGGTLLGATVIDSQTNTFLIRSAAVNATAAGALNLSSTQGYVQWISATNVPTGFVASDNLAEVQSNGVTVMQLTDTSVKLNALANADATKFLQSDAAGVVTPVAAFTNFSEAVYAGTITWTGGTAPTGATNHTYQATQTGKLVAGVVHLLYGTVGVLNTALQFTLPAGLPTPGIPAGFNTNNTPIYNGSVKMMAALGGAPVTMPASWMQFDGTNWIFKTANFTATGVALVSFSFEYLIA